MKRLVMLKTWSPRLLLPLALAAALGSAAHAQLTLPASKERPAEAATIAAPSQALQLEEARASGHPPPHPAQDKQRLLDWLVDLHREKAKRLEELLAQHDMAQPSVDDDPLVRALQGAQPHSAVQVDTLRDEIDGLKEKLAAAEAAFRANQTEMQTLTERLKAREMVLVYWGEFDDPKGPRRVDSDLRHDIYGRLAAAGIAIPFQQRELRVDLTQPVLIRTAHPEAVHGA